MNTWPRKLLRLASSGLAFAAVLGVGPSLHAQAISTRQVSEAACRAATPGCGGPCRAEQVSGKSLRLLLECIYQRTLDLPAWEHANCDRSHRHWQAAAADAAWEVAHRAWIVDDSANVDHLFARAANVALSGVPASSDGSTSKVCGAAKSSIERGCQIAQCAAAGASKLEAAARDYKAVCGESLRCSALDTERCALLAGVRAQRKLLYAVQGGTASEQESTAPITRSWNNELESVESRVLSAEPTDLGALKASLERIERTKAAPALVAVMERKTVSVAAQLQRPEIPASRRSALAREQKEATVALEALKSLERTGAFKDVKERALRLDSELGKLKSDIARAPEVEQ